MNRIIAFLTSAALLTAVPAFAQTSFSEWDEDGDGILTQEEWDAGVADSGVFDSWDGDDDGVVSAAEYEDGLFDWFDDDDDGALTVSEWDEGVDAWYGEAGTDLDVSAWDDDGDGIITETEINDEYTTAGLFEGFTTESGVETVSVETGAAIDGDVAAEDGDAAGVREQDFFAGLFDWFDADDDTGIVADEAGWFG